MSNLKAAVSSALASRRNTRAVALIDRLASELHRAVVNLNYDMETNGERRVIQIGFGERESVIFDVGANDGSWSLMAAAAAPRSQIWAFEIVPETFETLLSKTTGASAINPVQSGLSDQEAEVTVYCIPGQSGLSSCVPQVAERFHQVEPTPVRARVTTGAKFCEANDISHIDLLKIDVEGLEPQVLAGFEPMLEAAQIDAVQVEYGFANVESRFLLRDFCEYFARFDMVVGKVFPNSVDFRDYAFTDEDFLGPNYLAVRRPLVDLVSNLRG